MRIRDRLGWWLIGAFVFVVSPIVKADPWDAYVVVAVDYLEEIQVRAIQANSIAAQRQTFTSNVDAQIVAELSGLEWPGYNMTSTGTISSTTYHNPYTLGLLRAIRTPTQAAGIADATNKTIWGQLDAIRLNTGTAPTVDMTATNSLLTQMRDALIDTDTLKPYLQAIRDESADSNDILLNIQTNTASTAIAASGLGTQFGNWRGEGGQTWSWFTSRFDGFATTTEEQLNDIKNALTGAGVVEGHDTGALDEEAVQLVSRAADMPAVGNAALKAAGPSMPEVPEAAVGETDAPDWSFSVPMGTWSSTLGGPSLPNYSMSADFSVIPNGVRLAVHAFIICFVTLNGMMLVWEEFRRYG